MDTMQKWTLCMITKGNKVLLKFGSRSISKNKWNGLGGKIDDGETPEEGLIREVKEESGLTVTKMKKFGNVRFYKGSKKEILGIGHVFLVTGVSGKAVGGEEGEVRWFSKDKLPLDKMWEDDRYWLPLLFEGKGADMEFLYDNRMKHVKEYHICNIRKM